MYTEITTEEWNARHEKVTKTPLYNALRNIISLLSGIQEDDEKIAEAKLRALKNRQIARDEIGQKMEMLRAMQVTLPNDIEYGNDVLHIAEAWYAHQDILAAVTLTKTEPLMTLFKFAENNMTADVTEAQKVA